jgi:hypothetical protein
MLRRAALAALRLYPSRWRARYEDEVRALLEERPPRPRDTLDLVRGALDAWLHPPIPSRVPGIAAIVGGGIWTLWSVVIMTDATAPDWPGYLEEMLLSAVLAVGALVVALTGAWLRIGDDATRVERLAIALALTGHAAWLILLFGAISGLVYGAPTAVASTAAAIGAVLVGFCLVAADDVRVGALVATAAVGLLIPFVGGWLVFGVCWMAAGLAMLTNPRGGRRLAAF